MRRCPSICLFLYHWITKKLLDRFNCNLTQIWLLYPQRRLMFISFMALRYFQSGIKSSWSWHVKLYHRVMRRRTRLNLGWTLTVAALNTGGDERDFLSETKSKLDIEIISTSSLKVWLSRQLGRITQFSWIDWTSHVASRQFRLGVSRLGR